MEHEGALAALLWLAPATVATLLGLESLARRDVAVAARLVTGLLALEPHRQVALLLIAVTATIHAALIPEHAVTQPVTALLFALFCAGAFATLIAAALGVRGWSALAALLLGGAIVAYAIYLVSGLESPDAIGVATKAVEAAALALVLTLTPPAPPRQSRPLSSSTRRRW